MKENEKQSVITVQQEEGKMQAWPVKVAQTVERNWQVVVTNLGLMERNELRMNFNCRTATSQDRSGV